MVKQTTKPKIGRPRAKEYDRMVARAVRRSPVAVRVFPADHWGKTSYQVALARLHGVMSKRGIIDGRIYGVVGNRYAGTIHIRYVGTR